MDWDERADSEIPSWCYPASSWELRTPEGDISSELGHCLEIEKIRNVVGETYGLLITYAHVKIMATAGENFDVEIIPSEA
ncbi:hypothetical protein AB0939_27790 [Streptomyces sp. NPDC006990]|uniref:hypothetical protein n=1 Tax=Streptomyces sp. NPDC006990 TaxID=3154481 RepID=UPI0034570AF7